tara:strand:- start:622 stop:1098 length:477 start_codon:yes stop_codon:yes gene_type:complete
MKFDLSSLVITVIALLAFIIPVSIDQRNKRKTAKTLKKLKAYATNQKLNIDKSDVFQQTYALGLDTKLKKLIYLKNDGNEFVEDLYDLTEFSKCRLYQPDVDDKSSEFWKVSYLRLQYMNPKAQPLDLEIYKVKENLSYTEEEAMAKKMVKSINYMLL